MKFKITKKDNIILNKNMISAISFPLYTGLLTKKKQSNTKSCQNWITYL